MKGYWDRTYRVEVKQSNDILTVDRSQGDWLDISITTNGHNNGSITLRSPEMVEQLRFALGQCLSG